MFYPENSSQQRILIFNPFNTCTLTYSVKPHMWLHVLSRKCSFIFSVASSSKC